MVPDRQKKDGEEKFQRFQKCFQEVLQSCGVAVGEPGLQDQGESEPGEARTDQGSPSDSEVAEKEKEEKQPSETKAETKVLEVEAKTEIKVESETKMLEVEDKSVSNVKVEAQVLEVEAMKAEESKVEVELESSEKELERKTVRYYCYGCSKEMPGVAAGPSCPSCDSGNNSQSVTGFRVILTFSCFNGIRKGGNMMQIF